MDTAITETLLNTKLIGHICDEPAPGILHTVWNTPLYRPVLSLAPTPEEILAQDHWDTANGWVSSLLTSHLTDVAQGYLGNQVDSNGKRRTAHTTCSSNYNILNTDKLLWAYLIK